MTTSIDHFQAIADPSRRAILMMVAREKLSMSQIASRFDISRPAVSKHVKILCDAGFIVMEDQGRERYCMLHQAGFDEIRAWTDHFEQYWKTRLKGLEALLAADHAKASPQRRTRKPKQP